MIANQNKQRDLWFLKEISSCGLREITFLSVSWQWPSLFCLAGQTLSHSRKLIPMSRECVVCHWCLLHGPTSAHLLMKWFPSFVFSTSLRALIVFVNLEKLFLRISSAFRVIEVVNWDKNVKKTLTSWLKWHITATVTSELITWPELVLYGLIYCRGQTCEGVWVMGY